MKVNSTFFLGFFYHHFEKQCATEGFDTISKTKGNMGLLLKLYTKVLPSFYET